MLAVGDTVSLFEGTVESGMVPITEPLANGLERRTLFDQWFRGNQTKLGDVLVKTDSHFLFEKVANSAGADEKLPGQI